MTWWECNSLTGSAGAPKNNNPVIYPALYLKHLAKNLSLWQYVKHQSQRAENH
ncbi:MAG: hypothetical protein NE328_24910 [Lentisphaeraceae bacterium]|nr:hypothetical protein [Lentisphaeraceae bacterium]